MGQDSFILCDSMRQMTEKSYPSEVLLEFISFSNENSFANIHNLFISKIYGLLKLEIIKILDIIKARKTITTWHYLSCNIDLSEDFMLHFGNYLDWLGISFYQKLSIDFILNNLYRLNLRDINLNKRISNKNKLLLNL